MISVDIPDSRCYITSSFSRPQQFQGRNYLVTIAIVGLEHYHRQNSAEKSQLPLGHPPHERVEVRHAGQVEGVLLRAEDLLDQAYGGVECFSVGEEREEEDDEAVVGTEPLADLGMGEAQFPQDSHTLGTCFPCILVSMGIRAI